MNRRPNILVFFTDQQRWDTVGAHGNALDVTPNFDRFAAAGSLIQNSFTCQPVCGPARSVLQTGKYPTTTGCHVNGRPLPENERTLAHHFGDAGYRTGYIGKWHLASCDPVPKNERGGYDNWLASNILEFTSWPYETTLYDENCEPQYLPGYRVDAMTDAAIRFIDEDVNDPFFLFLSFLEPHHQNQHDNYPAPVGYAERLNKRGVSLPNDLERLGGTSREHYFGYMGMVAKLDEALGRVTDALISKRMLNNTIILFTSDHGCHFKTRNDEYKRSCHEASIRVPTFFHGPGFMGGNAITRDCSLIDIPPTLLDAAGLEIPDEMQGHSLQAAPPSGVGGIFIQISESQIGRALRHGQWKYAVTAPDGDPVQDAFSLQYVESHLYDLKTDPDEQDNKVSDPKLAHIREQLSKRLIDRMVDAGEDAPSIVAAYTA